MIKRAISLLALVLTNLLTAQPVEMADGMRADGKIYVVVVVLLAVLISLFAYLFKIEKQVKKLEDKA